MTTPQSFVKSLRAYRSGPGVFNPWRDADLAYDTDPGAPAQRARHLEHYLSLRMPHARYILIAEAVGYQGGRFSGVAMTSERMLLGKARGINPEWALPAGVFRRTSRPDLKPDGFAEPTATIVWSTLLALGVAPTEFMLWNAFPFHPYKPGEGLLSNRTPTPAELEVGGGFARRLVKACPQARVVAVGAKSESILAMVGIPTLGAVRHPANGGATAFRSQVRALVAG